MATKRIAVVATIYRYLSHAQHFADRFFVGYPYGGQWHRPDCELVSIYVDQKPEGDQSEDRAREFGGAVYPTISEALRCGGGVEQRLAARWPGCVQPASRPSQGRQRRAAPRASWAHLLRRRRRRLRVVLRLLLLLLQPSRRGNWGAPRPLRVGRMQTG